MVADPRMRCINLARAVERRVRFTADWIEGLGLPVTFFPACDRRDVEAGRVPFACDEAAARRRIGRPMTPGEVACAASHALAMREELGLCGPEGVLIFEDDALPLPGAERLIERVRAATSALPGVEVVACHEPYGPCVLGEEAGGTARVISPPWGAIATWYSPRGLARACELMARMEVPADWVARDLASEGLLAILRPPVARHDGRGTTYIDNTVRSRRRRFIP